MQGLLPTILRHISKYKIQPRVPAAELLEHTRRVLRRRGPHTRKRFQFTFLVGASGSGTTMLTRILSRLPNAICLGGNHTKLLNDDAQARELLHCFEKNNALAWDRYGPFLERQAARENLPALVAQLLTLPGHENISQVIFKRSAPFYKEDRFRPDLADIVELFPESKIIAIYRDPCASTYSCYRRKFAGHLGRCAIITEEQLTYLAAQLQTLPASAYRIIPYEHFCQEWSGYLPALAEFLDIPLTDFQDAADVENISFTESALWQRALCDEERNFLIQFFNERRRQQWSILSSFVA